MCVCTCARVRIYNTFSRYIYKFNPKVVNCAYAIEIDEYAHCMCFEQYCIVLNKNKHVIIANILCIV